jgi:hypothetical protein
MNCFILHFNLKEDNCFYYLYSEFPGIKADDIVIKPYNNYILIIYGATHCPSTSPLG